MPISDELHDLVGSPVPSSDLGQRARARATELKHRRTAAIVTSVAAVAVLAVPSLIFASGSGEATGSPGAGSSVKAAPPAPAGAKPTGIIPASARPSDSAEQAAKKSAFAALNGGSFQKPVNTVLVNGPLTAADNARAAHTLQLLGSGFRQEAVQVEQDASTGARLGLVASFVADAGGGTVGVVWQPVPVEHAGATKGTADSGGQEIKAGLASGEAKSAPAGPAVEGVEANSATMNISMKVVQGSPGSATILPGKAAETIVHALLDAE